MSAPALLAAHDIVARAFKAEADELHACYRRHVRVCWATEHGIWCRACRVLLDAADDAGKKARLAEERTGRWR